MSEPVLLHSVQDVLEAAAGFHDLNTYSVESRHVEEDVVARHEALHDQILTETPFGTTQFLFKRAELVAEDGRTTDLLRRWSSVLATASAKTHERAATYCSIKHEQERDIPRVLERHSEQYVSYYDDVAELVDPAFGSTYLQLLVGMTVVEICFSSRVQQRIVSEGALPKPGLTDFEAPNQRFAILRDHGIKKEIEALSRQLDTNGSRLVRDIGIPTGFDLHADHDWERLPISLANQLDDHMQALIRRALYQRANQWMPCLLVHEWAQPRDQLLGLLSRMIGRPLFDERLPPHRSGSGSYDDGVLLKRAHRAAESRVINRQGLDPQRIAFHECDDPMGLLEGPKGPRTLYAELLADGSFAHGSWLWVVEAESETEVRRVRPKHMESFFKLRGLLASTMGYLPTVDALIVATELGEAFAKFHNDLVRWHAPSGVGMRIENLVWYMRGNLFEWLQWLQTLGPVTHMMIYGVERPPNPADVERLLRTSSPTTEDVRSLGAWMSSGLQGHMLLSRGLQGRFLRWFPLETSRSVSPGLAAYELSTLPESEREEHGAVCLRTLKPLSTFSGEL